MLSWAGAAPGVGFSVVVPSRNRPEQLRCCLEALAGLRSPRGGYEVIVVDDGSLEPYAELVGEYSGRMRVSCLRREGGGPGKARNAGVEAAGGQWIALTDDDCTPEPGWLEELAAVLDAEPEAMVGGRTVNELGSNPYSEASQLLISYLYEYFNEGARSGKFFASCNMAMGAGAFRELKGFDPAFALAAGEDRDFCDRWAGSGRPMVYAERAVVHHRHELSFRRFLRQHFNYGRGARQFHLAKADRRAGRVRVEPLKFYAGLVLYPFRVSKARGRVALSALMGLSQAANAAGFFFQMWFGRGRQG